MILHPDEIGCYAAHFEDVAHIIDSIELPNWGALEVQRYAWEGPQEADITAVIELMRYNAGNLETLSASGTVQIGDLVTVDVQAWAGKDPMPGGRQDDLRFRAGEYPEFTQGVISLKTGESRTLWLGKLTDYPDKWIASQDCEMTFTVKKIERRRVPEWGPKLFKRLGVSGLDELKAGAEHQLRLEVQAVLRKHSTRVLLEQIIRNCPIEVPDNALETEMGQPEAGETRDQEIKRMLKAAHRVQLGILFARVARDEHLFASDEQVSSYIKWIADQRGASKKKRRAMERRRSDVAKLLTERNVIDHLLSKVKTQFVTMDLKKLRGPASDPQVELAVAIPGANRQGAVAQDAH